ncbi:MAG: hypothetical protein ABI175_21360 [Polyangiales bacterium]
MRAPLLVSLVLLGPVLVGSLASGCKENTGATPDAASPSGSPSPSTAATDAGPPIYGVLTDEEITDALKRKRVIALVRVKAQAHDDVGTKNEAIRSTVEVIKALNSAPPAEAVERGATSTLVVGKAYAVVIDRRYLRLLVRAVEVADDKLGGTALGLEETIAKIAPIVAAAASADIADDDDDAPPSSSGSGSASAKPSASTSASTKPSASTSASTKPSVTVTAKPSVGPSMTAGTPKAPPTATTK